MRVVMRTLISRLAMLRRRGALEADLDAELATHLEMAVEANLDRGMSEEEARRAARRALGGVERVRELCRDERRIPLVETGLQDLRLGLRMLRRSPSFFAVVLCCLTLGIGANTAVLSWIEGILFRPYPAVADQDRLLVLAGTARGETGYSDVSWPDFQDLQRSAKLVELIADKITGVTLGVGDRAELVAAGMVSANYFTALGIQPALGRGFAPGEDLGRNAHPVTVISYEAWRERYRGDPGIVGRTQMLNGRAHTIIGVAPPGFHGTFVGYTLQFWVPVAMQETFDSSGYKLEDRGARWIEGFARLKPGVGRREAAAELAAAARSLEATYPETNRGHGIELVPLWRSPFNASGTLLPTLRIAGVMAILLLVIVCANVGNLMLVRMLARQQEMTIRLALGCGRGRLVRQLLTEMLLVAALAAGGGVLVAYWLRDALVLLVPWRGIRVFLPGTLDWRVLAGGAALLLVATVISGLVPCLRAGRVDLAGALNTASRSVLGGRGRRRLRTALVLVQVAFGFVLLVGAGLLMRSVRAIRESSPGFATDGVLVTAVNLMSAGYDLPRARVFEDRLMERVAALPGVTSAAYCRILPFSLRSYSAAPVAVDGYQPAADEQPTVEYDEVSPAFFSTLAMPLRSGREFDAADDAGSAPVAIVNETMAARFWRGADPVGRSFRAKDRALLVVGVVRDAKYRSFQEKAAPFFFVPLRQSPSTQVGLAIRTPLDARTVGMALARELRSLDSGVSALETITMRTQVDRSTSAQRIAVTLLDVFGGIALLLGAIGLYGVMAYLVSQSRRELGLRMALGAGAADVARWVIGQGMALAAGGVALGALVALASTRLLGDLLYRVGPRDPLAFGAAFALMAVVSLVACALPAWRAARTDPVRELRE